MKQFAKSLMYTIVILCLISMPVFAHSGDTDSKGGHTDHSTGDYHYHHGYPAHDHYDMDGDGDRDCPYLFDDKTGIHSGNASSGSNSAATDVYLDGYDDGYMIGFVDGMNESDAQWKEEKAALISKHQEELDSIIGQTILSTLSVCVFIGLPLGYLLIYHFAQKNAHNIPLSATQMTERPTSKVDHPERISPPPRAAATVNTPSTAASYVMQKTPIENVEYKDNRLYVTFANGSVYYYYGVPEEICRSMIEAPAPRTYFLEHIEGIYPYMLVK